MKSLMCQGGPEAGNTHVLMTESRIYWLVENRLVANTADLEWTDVEKVRGAYLTYSRTINRQRRDVLIWRALPNNGSQP